MASHALEQGMTVRRSESGEVAVHQPFEDALGRNAADAHRRRLQQLLSELQKRTPKRPRQLPGASGVRNSRRGDAPRTLVAWILPASTALQHLRAQRAERIITSAPDVAKQRAARAAIIAIVQQEIDFHDWKELQRFYSDLRDISSEEFLAYLTADTKQTRCACCGEPWDRTTSDATDPDTYCSSVCEVGRLG